MTYLLDVNVLIALFDPAHPGHEAAHSWFGRAGKQSWATCALTENGVVRILSHPSYPSVRATPAEMAERLRQLCAEAGHEYWPSDLSLLDLQRFSLELVSGPGQITDVYLLGLAASRAGKLATFDRKIPAKTVQGGRDALELI